MVCLNKAVFLRSYDWNLQEEENLERHRRPQLQMNFTSTRGLRKFHQLQSLKLIYSRTFYSTCQPAEHFSGCFATSSSLSCPQCSRKTGLTSIYSSRTIRTSSLKRTCSTFNDAFSETNKVRFVKQLGRMKTRKSLLASCSEEAAVFVPFCVVDSVPSVLFTLRSNKLNKHRGEVRSVLSSLIYILLVVIKDYESAFDAIT